MTQEVVGGRKECLVHSVKARKMALWLKGFGTKTDDLSLYPWTQEKEELTPSRCPLTFEHDLNTG